jgi:hypothetical protein
MSEGERQPLASELTGELMPIPDEGLVFVLVRLPEGAEPGAFASVLSPITRQIKAVNPDAHLLVLGAGWSFRTLKAKDAREFARNMISFMSEDDLAEIGVHRIEETMLSAGEMTPEQIQELKTLWEKVNTTSRMPLQVQPPREKVLADFFDALPSLTAEEMRFLGISRNTYEDNPLAEIIDQIQSRYTGGPPNG